MTTLTAIDVSASVPSADGDGRRQILRGLSLTVGPGEIVGVTGPSGSGKTVLTRVLCGLHPADSGSVLLGDTPVVPLRSRAAHRTRGRIGAIFQSPRAAMDPHLTLEQSIRLSAREASRRVSGSASPPALHLEQGLTDAARSVGLSREVLERRPAAVSDGELQRAAVLRTFAHLPEIVLCDEITASLDPISAASVATMLKRMAADRGCGLLVISHDVALVKTLAHRVITMERWTTSRGLSTGAPE